MLNYTSSKEALGEHFHMSEDLLAAINPGKKFDRAGDKINVASLSADKQSSKVSRIEVDKGFRILHRRRTGLRWPNQVWRCGR